jgi:hypothetical protein
MYNSLPANDLLGLYHDYNEVGKIFSEYER